MAGGQGPPLPMAGGGFWSGDGKILTSLTLTANVRERHTKGFALGRIRSTSELLQRETSEQPRVGSEVIPSQYRDSL